MNIFSSKRQAYLDELDKDPEVQKIVNDASNRFRLGAEKNNANGSKKQWNPDFFKKEIESGEVKFRHDYGVMVFRDKRYGYAQLYQDGTGGYQLSIHKGSSGNINPTPDPAFWDGITKTILYVDKDTIDTFNSSQDLREQIIEALDKNQSLNIELVIK